MPRPPFYRPPGSGPIHPIEANALSVLSRGQPVQKTTQQQAGTPTPSQPSNQLTYTAKAPIMLVGTQFSIPLAGATGDGYLYAADWTTFNGKEPALGNPGVNGYLLSSTTAGVRSWVAPGAGGGQQLYPTMTAPVTGSMTWLNQGTATLTTTSLGFGSIRVLAAGGDIVHGLYQAKPAGSAYTVTIAFFVSGQLSASRQAGMLLYDSGSTKLYAFTSSTATGPLQEVSLAKWSDPNTAVANLVGPLPVFASGLLWLKFYDNATNRFFYYSNDGENWIQFFTEATGTYLAIDKVGFFANTSDANSDCVITCAHFTAV